MCQVERIENDSKIEVKVTDTGRCWSPTSEEAWHLPYLSLKLSSHWVSVCEAPSESSFTSLASTGSWLVEPWNIILQERQC